MPIAAARAGAVGLLDLTCLRDVERARAGLARLARLARGPFGVVLRGRLREVEQAVLSALDTCDTILLTPESEGNLGEIAARAWGVAHRVGLVATSESEARLAARVGLDFVVAKGHEAGGRVGEETTFVLLQRLLAWGQRPVWAWGGVGLHTAAACRVAGAAGVVLDWQLALVHESPLPDRFKRCIAAMDGSETCALPCGPGRFFRCYDQPGMSAGTELAALSDRCGRGEHVEPDAWDRTVAALLAEPGVEQRLWPVGQDAALAATWAAQAPNVAQAIRLLRERVELNATGCAEACVLREGGPLARSHGTAFPVVQGPMTRVSDTAEFCEAVAEAGGLPFLALALMRRDQVRELLEQTRARLGGHPWGVGILGFVQRDLRLEQLAVVEEVRPQFALIAGGRPDQAAALEARGITTYLHVPSPGMLEMFIQEGVRRFIFEGRECGGHVGPRTSFVLWDQMIQVLLAADLSADERARVHVLFAGGIHDALGGGHGVGARPAAGRALDEGRGGARNGVSVHRRGGRRGGDRQAVSGRGAADRPHRAPRDRPGSRGAVCGHGVPDVLRVGETPAQSGKPKPRGNPRPARARQRWPPPSRRQGHHPRGLPAARPEPVGCGL